MTTQRLSQLLYKHTCFEEWGDRPLYDEVRLLPEVFLKTYYREGWAMTLSIRQKGEQRFVIIHRWPHPSSNNIYEEVELWEGGKPLPPEVFE
jgi:hypothetical protein